MDIQQGFDDPQLSIELVRQFRGGDIHELCEAAEAAILDGGGFGWVAPPSYDLMENHYRGVLLVPERDLFMGKIDQVVGGAAQLIRPNKSNEARAFQAYIGGVFVAPWARGYGLGRKIIEAVEEQARSEGFLYIGMDIRVTQTAAIKLYESMGYECWGENQHYAYVNDLYISGKYYKKKL